MTQSIKELVRAFKKAGGKVDIIPNGVGGQVVWKSWLRTSRAHSRRVKEARLERLDARLHGEKRENIGCSSHAAVDIFIKFRNAKGI